MPKPLNILFLTIFRFQDIEERGIYTDLMRKFRDEGHQVYVVSPLERRYNQKTSLRENNGIHILGVKTLNQQKTNFIEKGIGTLLLEYQFQNAIKTYISHITFDLVLYSTPPITFTKVIKTLKNKCNPTTYLLLKDIFPQNAVDLELISKNSLLHKFFRKKEMDLYKISDAIGCMSPANKHYILENNPFIDESKVEVNPNSMDIPVEQNAIDVERIRNQFQIPLQTTTFIYGGNLGKPQGIDFIIEILSSNSNRLDCFFVICGSGTEYDKLSKWYSQNNPTNSILINTLPQKEYNELVQVCDVGLIFLDHRFTIPNFPSRLLSYLEYKKPIIAATDPNTDIGKIAEENKFGFYCESNSIHNFNKKLNYCIQNKEELQKMGENGCQFLKNNYSIEKSYQMIMEKMDNN